MAHKLSEIKGLDPATQSRLEQANIHTVDDLLNATHTPQQRAALAKHVGVSPGQLTDWINRADLMRLKGVGKEMANLLEESGVDSCKELQHRKADHLQAKLKEVNDAKHITHHAPTIAQVEEWISESESFAQQA
jgi:predicted flap endonuclease-1-like 5' DNA nuclease